MMMVFIFVNNIILERMTWNKVPRLLKDDVAKELMAMGCGFLIDEEDRKKYTGKE